MLKVGNWVNRTKIHRRHFLGGAAAMGLGSGFSPWGFASVAHADEEPKSGGILTTNFTTDPPNFDPLSNTTGRVIQVIGPCYNSLVMLDPLQPDEIVGDLAEDWHVSEDGLTFTFRLRNDVTFHDGAPFTSEDVKYTFDTIRRPPEGVVSVRAGDLTMVDSIEAVDEHTVVFRLQHSYPAFLDILATGWMLVLPKHVLEQPGGLTDKVVGTGPFMLDRYRPGVSIDLIRNPNYHIAGRPYLDGIRYYVIPDRGTVLANFRTGNLHVFDGIRPDEIRRAQAAFPDDIVTYSAPGLAFGVVTINTLREPWSDIRVRRAASLAIDRSAGIDILLEGEGVVGGLMPPGKWQIPQEELEEIPGYGGAPEDNLAEARRLMAEAGYEEGFDTSILTRRTNTHEARAVFVQDQLSKININARIDMQEPATFTESYMARDFDLTPFGNSLLVNDPDPTFGSFYECDAPLNASGVCLPEVTELFQQQKELEGDARRAVVAQMEKLVLEQYGDLILFWMTRFLGHRTNVHGLILHPEMDNNRRMQDVWLS